MNSCRLKSRCLIFSVCRGYNAFNPRIAIVCPAYLCGDTVAHLQLAGQEVTLASGTSKACSFVNRAAPSGGTRRSETENRMC